MCNKTWHAYHSRIDGSAISLSILHEMKHALTEVVLHIYYCQLSLSDNGSVGLIKLEQLERLSFEIPQPTHDYAY